MSRLSLVERTKLNLAEVTIAVAGGGALEIDLLTQMFMGFGARQLRRAETLQDLREILSGEPVDLLVLNASGDVDETLEVVRELRRGTSSSRYAPVVLAGANVSPFLLRAGMDAGASYVVAKPLEPRVLFERLVWIVKDARPFVECDTYVGPDRRVRSLGPPAGLKGRRAGDLGADLGVASTPNMSQADIDAMMLPVRKAL